MIKTILQILIVLLTLSGFSQDFITGLIDDPDGYTNIRKEPNSNSQILCNIIEGDLFLFHTNNSNWWTVKYGEIKGYVHKNRIKSENYIKNQIDTFLIEFYQTDRNNVELGEGNNEKLFLLAKKYPSVLLTSFCGKRKEIQVFLISEFESPIHDLIDLQLIYDRLTSIKIDCLEKYRIFDAIKLAGQNSGLKIK